MTIECTSSSFETKTLKQSGNPAIEASFTGLNFGGCVNEAEAMCTVEAVSLPYYAEFFQPEAGGNGRLASVPGAGSAPTVDIQCGEVHCIYGNVFKFQIEAGASPSLWVFPGGLDVQTGSDETCQATATWSGEYTVTEPKPLFVVAKP